MRSRTASAVGRAISSTIRPSARKSTRSEWAAAPGSWVTMTTVWPRSSTASRRKPRTSRPARESRLPVGSSAKISSGREASARAQATRCCWPPESWDGRCFSRSRSPRVSMTWSSHFWSGFWPAMSIGRVMFSTAFRVGIRLNDWNMKPIRSRRSRVRSRSFSPVISVSPSHTCPADTVSSPARQCISVDLPDPDGPMTAVKRPRAMSTSTESRASTVVSPEPYALVSARARAAVPSAFACPGACSAAGVDKAASFCGLLVVADPMSCRRPSFLVPAERSVTRRTPGIPFRSWVPLLRVLALHALASRYG